jgi:hypothetical protein
VTVPGMSDEQQRERLRVLNVVFRPGAPVDREDLFSGRGTQLAAVFEAMQAVGQHAVIFGERGVGKTSLAAVCADMAGRTGAIAMRINCDQSDNFNGIWQKVIDEFAVVVADSPDELQDSMAAATEKATDVLNYGDVGPNQVRVAMRHLTHIAPVTIFFDEFDQISDGGTLVLVSNTVKLLSDHIESVTLIPVGVSDSVSDLIAGHQSIQRALVQVNMPRMQRHELESILDRGLQALQMTADPAARGVIRTAPRGLPQYAHLLAQEGARQAMLAGRTEITSNDVLDGLQVGLSKVDHTLSSAFDVATYTAKASRFADVLYACTLTRPDESGFFSPSDLRRPYSKIVGESVSIDRFNPHLVQLTENRGQILTRKGRDRAWRYRFSDPLMEPYVLLKGISGGKIKPEHLSD